MCGVAGIWERGGEPADRAALARMGDSLVHRGPDGLGTHVHGSVGLVSRRLRIIDLDARGDQPMGLPERDLWLSFNGEIHNYLELRSVLERSGARFRTRTDTEVVLWAYALWGVESFDRFNGMWAIALWDGARRELVLSRDRFGIKPLCYCVRGSRLCFASEAKAILAVCPQERIPDGTEVERFLRGAYPDASEATFFENIKSVPRASYMVFAASGVSTSRYWSFRPGRESHRPDAGEEFRSLVDDAVRLRARSDAPLGACLSGGLDSSALVGLLSRHSAAPVHCFSTAYDDAGYDESHYARLVADRYPLVMHWVRPDPREMIPAMHRLVWHHDSPTPIRGRLAHWFVMREAGNHVKTTIEGHGSDELLAGYAYDILPYLADRIQSERRVSRATVDELLRLRHVEGSLPWFLGHSAVQYRRDPRRKGDRPYASVLNNRLWNGLCRDGLPESLRGVDAVSMAHSVEARVPFLDHRIVELCFSLPYAEKISAGWTKSLLRRSMADVIPEPILQRRGKYGFAAPITPWLRRADNMATVRELLLDQRARERGYWDGRRMERELAAFARGPFRYARWRGPQVWRWLTLEIWFRQFIDPA